MPQIEIDFEVFKALTNQRPTEDVTYNDVIRKILKLTTSPTAIKPSIDAKPWVVSDTNFPAGSEFMAEYKGKLHFGVVRDAKLHLDGYVFSTPSAAAVHVTGSNVNGWRFWKCKLPGASHHVLIERLRGKAH